MGEAKRKYAALDARMKAQAAERRKATGNPRTRAEIVTKRFVRCPRGCDHLFEVEHLFGPNLQGSSAGPWGCDVCGHTFLWDLEDGVLHVTEHTERRQTDRTILELPPQTESVFFTVRSMRFNEPVLTEKATEAHRFFFEEHTCPTNWMDRVEEIRIGQDRDPYGLFRYVRSYDKGADADTDSEANL